MSLYYAPYLGRFNIVSEFTSHNKQKNEVFKYSFGFNNKIQIVTMAHWNDEKGKVTSFIWHI